MPVSEKKWEIPEYLVIRDTREQAGWDFPIQRGCLGTKTATLKTGDYTLEGYEDVFVVERKRSTGEICTNLTDKRFTRELERLEEFKYPFLVCEFTLADVISFPHNSTIPKARWHTLRMSPQFMLKRLNDINLMYRTRIIFAGTNGREFCSSLFKRVVEHVERTPKEDEPQASPAQ